MSATSRLARAILCASLWLAAARAEAQQDFGHKTLGTLGLSAGSPIEPGLYVANRILFYEAGALIDRHGNPIPIGTKLEALVDSVGICGSYRLPQHPIYLTATFAAPVARLTAHFDLPDPDARSEASIDRFGLADIYFQPLALGWRGARLDAVTSYAFYIPTGHFEPGGGESVSRAQWSHEFSLGGTLFFDRARQWQLSALSSYELNQKKRVVDLTRGDTIEIQGGAGPTLYRILNLGVVGYALWQVRSDRGGDLPSVSVGARDRAFGLGAELDVMIPQLRTRVTARYAHDFAVESRPRGQIVLLGITVNLWRPRR